MTTLTDTQAIVLSAASRRPRHLVLPLPERLKGGAATKVVTGLLARGLAEEVAAAPGEPVWRETGAGERLTLVATAAALEALGIEPHRAPVRATKTAPADPVPEGAEAGEAAPAPAQARTPRAGTKQARLIAMLKAREGATIAEIVEATGWQPHTVRGAIAGSLKKRLGLAVTSAKVEGRGRVYRIAG